eukprot:PhF_6_TR30619/c0_g1_i1/m.45090
MLENTSSEAIHVWMKSLEDGTLSSFTTSDVETVLLCYKAGAALYFRANEAFEKSYIGNIAKDMGYSFANFHADGAARGEVEVFVSPPGHRTPFHFDFMENFTVQIKGSKTWRLAPSGISHPHRSCATHFIQSNSDRHVLHDQIKLHKLQDVNFDGTVPQDKIFEVTLRPGDVLYHPAGMWHEVSVVSDEPSLSINLSFMASTWGDLILSRVLQTVWATESLRERISVPKPDVRQNWIKAAQDKLLTFQQVVMDLKVENVVPISASRGGVQLPKNVLMTPRGEIVISKCDRVALGLPTSLPQLLHLKRNPFAIIVRMEERIEFDFTDDADEEDEEDGEGEDSGKEKNGDVDDEDYRKKLVALEELSMITFAIHAHFGNESMVSEVEIRAIVPSGSAAEKYFNTVALLPPKAPAPSFSGHPDLIHLLVATQYFNI